MSEKWIKAIAACTDLPRLPDAATVKSLYLSAFGGRRYLLLVGPQDLDAATWLGEMQDFCCAALLKPG